MRRLAVDRGVLAAGLVLAVASYALLHESFRPFATRAELQGVRMSHTFALPDRQPLFVEFELVLHADGTERPDVHVRMNGVAVTTLRPAAAFATERRHVAVPLAVVRDAVNRLEFSVEPATIGVAIGVRARVHNYYGIAPDVPRAAVVADEAVMHRFRQRSMAAHAGVFALVALASVWAVAAAAGLSRRRGYDPRWAWLTVVGPGLVLAYSLATPLHVWLSAHALLLATLVPWAIGVGLQMLVDRRRRLAPVLALAALTFASLEVALRLFNAVEPSFVFYADDYTRYRGRPGAPHFDDVFNSRGFNDVERSVERPAGVSRRIVAIGDSFAVGVVPRSANFLTLLERELGGPGATEVINLGVSGTESRDYLSVLVDEGLAHRPDTVLVTFYVGNDFETRARRAYEYSYVLTLGRALWRLAASEPSVPAADGSHAAYADERPSMPRDRFLEIAVDRSWVYDHEGERLEAAADRAAEHLSAMRDLAARAGAGFLVVVIPDEVQVDARLRAEIASARGVVPDTFDVHRPNRVLAAGLARRGVDVLDLLPAFSDASARARLYKPQDTHWNLAGNRLAAREIARVLSRR